MTRIAFMGTPPLAAHILKTLFEASSHIVAVYTQPQRKAGRGYALTPSAVQACADSLGLPVFTPETLKEPETLAHFQSLNLDVAVVAAYGLLLPKAFLDAPRMGCVNIHASLLPRWRGAAPVQYALMAGDAETGISLMKMDVGMDTGPVIDTAVLPLTSEDTTPGVWDKLAQLGGDLLLKSLSSYVQGNLLPIPQSETGVTYSPKIEKAAGHLCFTEPAAVLERKVRALTPVPGTWFVQGGSRIKVLKAACGEGTGEPGVLLDDDLTVACGQGTFQPMILQKEGGKPLDREAFLRGYPLPKGTLLNAL